MTPHVCARRWEEGGQGSIKRGRGSGTQKFVYQKYRGGGGGLVGAHFGKAKFGEGKFWYKILDTMEKCGELLRYYAVTLQDLGSIPSLPTLWKKCS